MMTTVLCVNCDSNIDYNKDDYEVGLSLGEYWCKECAQKEMEK